MFKEIIEFSKELEKQGALEIAEGKDLPIIKVLFSKKDNILEIKEIKFIDDNNVVYIGDETRDVEAAKKVGIEIISVCWGFNYKEILQTLNPNFIVESPEEILPCIRKILKV